MVLPPLATLSLNTNICFSFALRDLQGARVKATTESGGTEIVRVTRSLDEARALIEKSFGNYVGSEVMVAAKQQLARLQKDIEQLERECAKDDEGLEGRLTRGELQEYLSLKEKSKVAPVRSTFRNWLSSGFVSKSHEEVVLLTGSKAAYEITETSC